MSPWDAWRSQAGVAACAALILGGISIVSCDPNASTRPSPQPSDVINATQIARGCGGSPIYQGGGPAWLEAAGAHNNPSGPYLVGRPDVAVGFLFAQPLRAGHPENPSNKILWVVRYVNSGELTISAQPSGSDAPKVMTTAMPASPGYIYPSTVDVPSAGCWRLDLTWTGGHAAVYVEYV